MGKILIDLRNTREEAISVAGLKGSQEHHSAVTVTGKEDTESSFKNEDSRRASFNGDMSTNQEDDDGKETKYRLDPK